MENVSIVEGADAVEIADWIAGRLATALAANPETAAISVPGGSTPFPIFEELVKRDLDFSRLSIWPGDDRIVPEGHPASNTGKIRAIFEPTGADVGILEDALLAQRTFSLVRFSLCWLGMGADGHIASLFPNTDPQVDDPQLVRRLTPVPLPPEAPFDRITLTIPALLNTDAMLFVIRGEDKRAVFEAAMRREHDLPITRLLAASGERAIPVTCFT